MSAILEDGLARVIRIGQRRGVDMHHDLVALARRAGIELVMERRLRDQRQRVRLLLRHRRDVLTEVDSGAREASVGGLQAGPLNPSPPGRAPR